MKAPLRGWKDGSAVKEHLLLLQKVQVWFPKPNSGSLQPPVTPALRDATPYSKLLRDLNTDDKYLHIYTYLHI